MTRRSPVGPDQRSGWDAVVGQQPAVRVLTGALRAGEVGHAWLFVGRAGVGQRPATRAFAAALNCPASDDPTAGCGDCSVCARIARGTHPAVRDFEPEGAFHRVGAVRDQWIPAATTTPVEGTTKVLRIAEADRMNETAQNAFLKALEEPPSFTVWILEVEDDTVLLETVTSRCRRVDFTAPGLDAMRQLAEGTGVPAERRDGLARASMGSPRRLQAMAAQGDQPRRRHQGLLARLADEGPGAVPEIASELRSWAKDQAGTLEDRHEREQEELLAAHGVERRRDLPSGVASRLDKRQHRESRQVRTEALVQVLDDVGSQLRDLVALAGGAGPDVLVNGDRLGALRADAERLDTRGALTGLRAVGDARDALDRNGHEQLQLERLLLVLAVEVFR